MCFSKAQGGLRCPSHALIRMNRAARQYEADPTEDNYQEYLGKQAEWASTDIGEKQLRQDMERLEQAGDHLTAAATRRSIERGLEMRERAHAVRLAAGLPVRARHEETLADGTVRRTYDPMKSDPGLSGAIDREGFPIVVQARPHVDAADRGYDADDAFDERQDARDRGGRCACGHDLADGGHTCTQGGQTRYVAGLNEDANDIFDDED